MFKARKQGTLADLNTHLVKVSNAVGAKGYSLGDFGRDLYFVRKRLIRFSLTGGENHTLHRLAYARGALIGELIFLEAGAHSADVTTLTDVELFALFCKTFDVFAEHHKEAAANLFESLVNAPTI